MMGDGFEQRAAGFLLKKELTYFSKVCMFFPILWENMLIQIESSAIPTPPHPLSTPD